METTATLTPAATLVKATPVEQAKTKKKADWLVEVVGGFTVASTIVSAMTMWYLMLTFVLPMS